MKFLTLINNVKDLIRLEELHTLYDRSKVCGCIQGSSVRFQKHARRDLLGIALFFYIYNKCSLILIGEPTFLHILYHIRNVRLRVGFFFPEVKFYVQICIISLKVCYRYVHNVIPESHVSRFALLKKMGCLQCFIAVSLVLFGLAAGTWIDLFQFADGKRCFCGIFPGKAVIKIYQLRFPVFQLCDDQSHLKAPVSKMHIADHLVSYKTSDTLDALADDRRTEMSYVKGFGNVWSAVVDDDRLRVLGSFNGKLLIFCHLIHIFRNEFRLHIQVDKSRLYNFCSGKDLAV